jgi:uncharacterized protein
MSEDAGLHVAPSPIAATPVGESERLVTLDVLRGFALLGVCVVNMQFFTMPFAVALHDESLAQASWTSQLSWGVMKVFFESKSISLFSLLFGMGLVLQMMRAEAAGRAFVPLYLRRAAVLFAIGALHALIFWYGDILLIYSVTGLWLLLFLRLAPRPLLIAAAVCIAVGTVLFLLTAVGGILTASAKEDADTTGSAAAEASVVPGEERQAGEDAATEGDPDPDPDRETVPAGEAVPRGLAAIAESRGDPFHPAWIAGESAAYGQGPFSHAFAFRAVTYLYCVIGAILGYGWRILGLFLAGAALLKLGVFLPQGRPWQRRLAIVGLGVGLPMELISALWIRAIDYEIVWASLGAQALHEIGSTFLCFGYAGAIALIVSSGAMGGLCHALACVGRLALSNYLSQTLIAVFVSYWWGLGLFGRISSPWQLVLVAGIYTALALVSVLWLRVFTIGPAEWLWRSLTYGRRQPMRRRSVVATLAGAP